MCMNRTSSFNKFLAQINDYGHAYVLSTIDYEVLDSSLMEEVLVCTLNNHGANEIIQRDLEDRHRWHNQRLVLGT